MKMRNKDKVVLVSVGVILIFFLLIGFIQNRIDSKVGCGSRKKEVSSADMPYVPKGFKYIGGNISEGYVIEDKKTKSEFVWIPVSDISAFENGNVSNDGTTSYTNSKTKYADNTATTEYVNMLESVRKYGGFYIARYEAGKPEKYKDKMGLQINGEDIPVSIKGASVWGNIPWSDSTQRIEIGEKQIAGNDMSPKDGALKVSRAMYKENNRHSEVASTLVYGCQWNAVCKYISDEKSSSGEPYLLTASNSSNVTSENISKEQTALKTGQKDANKIKNIYDLSGNIQEWTMEYGNESRIARGDSYETKALQETPATSTAYFPDFKKQSLGFRVTLYIKVENGKK
ncbi:MAG: hypothetical protein RSE00_00430 [Clostridia bacterium]